MANEGDTLDFVTTELIAPEVTADAEHVVHIGMNWLGGVYGPPAAVDPSGVVVGYSYFNTTSGTVRTWDGTAWTEPDYGGGGGGGMNPPAAYDPALTSGDAGYLYFNTTHNKMRVWTGAAWEELTSVASPVVGPAPTITSFAPTSGASTTSVVITGTGFTGATAVKFNGVNAASYTVDSATQITAVVPATATTGPISVTTTNGTGTSSTNFAVAATDFSSLVLADSPSYFWKMWDASGASAADSSGNGKPGTYVGSPTLGAASITDTATGAKSVTLNGSSQYIERMVTELQPGAPWCVEIIFKPTTIAAGTFYGLVDARDYTGTSKGFILYLRGDISNHLQVIANSTTTGGVTCETSAGLVAGNVYHVVAGYDGTNLRIYVNGVLAAGPTALASWYGPSNVGWRIGNRKDGGGGFIPGGFQHFAFYPSMLSAARVLAHYNAL